MHTQRKTTHYFAMIAVLLSLVGALLQAANTHAATPEKEAALIETLRSGPRPDKAIACKKLAIYGSKQAVPELAALLSDEQLASWARIALEAIPDPSVDEALRTATKTLKGELLVGVINSIGVRHYAGAVDALVGHLKDQDVEVAAAAAVALGHIGTAPAAELLRRSLGETTGKLQSAVAEGCILCAERLMADGRNDNAAAIYEQVRKASLPKQRILEATRGEILARGEGGIALLIEQLRSPDKAFFYIGLTTARQSHAAGVADALGTEVARATPDRAALLLRALADRAEHVVPPAVVDAAKHGPKPVRIAAIEFIGRWGDASSLPTLLEIAIDSDAELAQAAKTALAGLPGEKVNADIVARLPTAEGKTLALLIELVGQRRIDATDALLRAVDHPDATIRGAALTALGETAGLKGIPVLLAQIAVRENSAGFASLDGQPTEVAQALARKNSAEAKVALQALRAACIRMPQREECAEKLAAAMSEVSVPTKCALLEILGAMGGAKALETVGAAARSADQKLQDTGTRLLGDWMTADAAPVLLDLVKNSHEDKYQLRALRGYIRLARQFVMPAKQRAEMCQTALEAATRPEEQKLVFAVLARYPSVDTLAVAIKATEKPAMKKEAEQAIFQMAPKLVGKSPEAEQMLAKAGIEVPRLEIIKAEYGAGGALKDVTEVLRSRASGTPQISLPSAKYNESFGGDPAPGVVKQLKVRYRINGKEGEATFAEDAEIDLPLPK